MKRELVTPASRAEIIRAVRACGWWKGHRAGVHIELCLTDQPDLSGNRLQWKASKNRKRYAGQAINVFDALESITSQMRENTP